MQTIANSSAFLRRDIFAYLQKCMKALVGFLLVANFNAIAQTGSNTGVAEYPTPMIREEQRIVVNGVAETWRLQWKSAPTPYCEADDPGWMTCPCTGFTYGEAGELFLARVRNGIEIERLDLPPLFEEQGVAAVQRWAEKEGDSELSDQEDFSEQVSKRPIVQIMHFADYDHDGQQTEFYIQTDALPCGKSAGIIIGLSTSNPHLHVFGTISHPSKPLFLQAHEWEALRNTTSHSVNVVDWQCGDHGADSQTELQLHWSDQGIDGVRREYTCPSKGETRQLINEDPL